MPSPVGHALAGVAVAALAGSNGAAASSRQTATWMVTCAALAAVPDLDLLLPDGPVGSVLHVSHRGPMHSIGAVALVIILATAVTGWVTGRFRWRIGLVCGAAYGSHLLLDWLATDPNPPFGIQALWPFSSNWFVSGWHVFRPTERRHFLSWPSILTNLEAMVQEVAVMLPIVALSFKLGPAGKRVRGAEPIGR